MRWLAGWSATTGHPWTTSSGVVRIEAVKSSRRYEYLLVEPAAGQVAAISRRIAGDSRDAVTVFTTDPGRYLSPYAGLLLDRGDEILMSCALRRSTVAIPDGFSTRWEEDGNRVTLSIEHGDKIAAIGNAAVVGRDVVFDRIETMPRFRRQGIGRVVMGLLTSWAHGRGGSTGILAASADGRRLYESLGWRHEGAMLMFRGVSGSNPSP